MANVLRIAGVLAMIEEASALEEAHIQRASKHVRWFLTQHLKDHSDATRYYYRLTALLVWKRLGNGRELLTGRSSRE